MIDHMQAQRLSGGVPLILAHKHYEAPSVFTPDHLIREARRQQAIPPGPVPPICILDPDGDLVDHLRATHQTRRCPVWACYHTQMDIFVDEGMEYGLIGRVVGAPYAVLVAEELFVSGCQLVISITSAGQIVPVGPLPYFVLIERALRNEGTSYHYLPPSPYSELRPELGELVRAGWNHALIPLAAGASCTTDAPFRETEALLDVCRSEGILAIEMEAAALYALAIARQKDMICFAHVTNQMGQTDGDFEKGMAQGSHAALEVIRQTAHCWRNGRASTTGSLP